MAFKTAVEIFGDNAGFGPAVPYAVTNPPGTNAGNRGIQFGEQLTASIANRTHYALALNDENLNTRLAAWETGGIDSAYDLGALAVPGGGRVITKDGGAVEARSSLAVQYADDPANAHFRASTLTDVVDGGGGFEAVGKAYQATAGSLYGFLDRRTRDFSGVTLIAGTPAITLNVGGAAPDGIDLGAGQYRDAGNNTHLILSRDMIEVLSGPHAGLYVISALPTQTRATVRRLDGSVPAFGANAASTARVCRPTFGSFSLHGQSGALELGTSVVEVCGLSHQRAAMTLIPGALKGRYGIAGTEEDGAQYAFSVKYRADAGNVSDVVTVDSLGQIRLTGDSGITPAADYAAGKEFGPAAIVIPRPNANPYETGVVVKSTGGRDSTYGVVVSEEARPASTPGGVIAFTFDAVAGKIDSADVLAVQNFVNAGITLIEIITPAAQAGIYRVSVTVAGVMTLLDLGGLAVSGFPVVGAGTFRILSGVYLGNRTISIDNPISVLPATPRVAAVIESPAQVSRSGLVLVAGKSLGQNAPLRVVSKNAGVTTEVAALDDVGRVWGTQFKYANPENPVRAVLIPLTDARPRVIAGADDWILEGTFIIPFPIISNWKSLTNSGYFSFPLNGYVPSNCLITDIQVITKPGAGRAGANRVHAFFYKLIPDFAVPGNNPVGPVIIADDFDDTTALAQVITLAASPNGGTPLGVGYVTDKSLEDYYLAIKAGATGAGFPDHVYGVKVFFADPGPRNF